ncbi:chromosome segregation protein SMC [Clostridioides mangenotii]|uniref:chromosome segregation protein SMC n=1 Tax=Metaclostridioides mangenotii TaxID=1540 RepID=UPI002149D832|nr:chromosome segregation protein SMC [Clostridioides mangenotii]MCR1953757.1 chromosome segregation protein SMC [Clostridioides mangenotii]
MYLKRLELKGFKSFPTKTDILFNKGVTSIVGPNGSGKSNISDAVRWVLGEQSIKSLRGDKLEDVIFIGTETKKAMNYCEVELTIDNLDNDMDIDFSEVTIKRRAYRNGESEFYLNNKVCRLKDIKELLLDTGIGKDGYSIVEQGKVDEILSNNPQNRRKIFDEACGISKYRYKKHEAEKNLLNTKENLERIQDIYIEIENQIKPLYNQQLKAKQYKELTEKLKSLEVNSFLRDIETLDNEITELVEHSKIIEANLKEKEVEKEKVEKEATELDRESRVLDDSIEKAVEYINSIKEVLSERDMQISLTNERIKNHKREIYAKQKEYDESDEKLKRYKENLKILESKSVENNLLVKQLETEITKLEANNSNKKSSIQDLNNEIENLKEGIIEILNKKQELSNKLSTMTANKDNMLSRSKDIESELDDINIKIQEKNKKLEASLVGIENNKKALNQLIEERETEQSEIMSLKNFVLGLDGKIQKTNYTLNDYKSKINIYNEMENHYEGFNRGVKEVLKNKTLNGIHGALGQLVEVPKKYEKAIESALGGYLQNIITKDEISAKNAINYLKKNNLGRVTFLPLSIIKGNPINLNAIKTNNKALGIASELVSYDVQYKNIFENVLGRTIIVGDMDIAIAFANEIGHKFKIVTLDGEVLNIGGSLTGGSLKTNGNILSRKRIITEYQESIEILVKEVASIQEEHRYITKEITEKEQNLTVLEAKLKDKEKQIFEINLQNNNFKSDINTLNTNYQKLEKEKSGLYINLDYTEERITSINNGIKELDQKHYVNKINIEKNVQLLKEQNDVFEGDKLSFDRLKLDLVKCIQASDTLVKDIERIKVESLELESKKQKLETVTEELKEEIKELSVTIQSEIEEKNNLEDQLVENGKSLENKRLAKVSIKEKFEESNKNVKVIDRQYIHFKESLFKVDSKLERLRESHENCLNKLNELYDLTFIRANELKDDNLCVDKKAIVGLKRDIKELGNINLGSIKEYEEVKERYDFYSVQKKDLEVSIESIENIISSLEKNMKDEFEIQFDKINEKYKYVHNRLFGGGNGELILDDKENILESDINIISQPPGKKMKNLNLLSGGEKALTAISILFSILMTKPTPFCILDEIEAPLDDANIFRFGEFLKELSEETQFIAVTHRRGTMQASDFIYGVTMQEKAISKIIGLKLSEAEKISNAM